MPLEIRELVIRTTVVPAKASRRVQKMDDLSQVKREIVAACLEEIRDEMKRKAER